MFNSKSSSSKAKNPSGKSKSDIPLLITLDGGDCIHGVSWQLREDGIMLLTGHGEMWNIKDRIQPWARHLDKIRHIRIEDGIQSIAAGAFMNCPNLTEVEFPDSLQFIGEDAFRNCDRLYVDHLPVHLMELGDNAFLHTDGFSGCRAKELPFDLRYIGSHAFHLQAGNPYLGTVRFSPRLRSIGEGAFQGCYNLSFKETAFPETLAFLGDNAFGGCMSIEAVQLPAMLKKTGHYTFAGCTSLESVDLGSVQEIGESAFEGCGKISRIIFPATVENICNKAFKNCFGLELIAFMGAFPFVNSVVFDGHSTYHVGQFSGYKPFEGTGTVEAFYNPAKGSTEKVYELYGYSFPDMENRWPEIIRYNWGARRMLWHDAGVVK